MATVKLYSMTGPKSASPDGNRKVPFLETLQTRSFQKKQF